MGWARGTFLISRLPHAAASPASPDTIKAASVTHVEHADLPRALATPPAPKSYPRKANPETLWLASNGRDPVDEDNLPFLDPEEVARHNNVVDGICAFRVSLHAARVKLTDAASQGSSSRTVSTTVRFL
jgi:hypothetical protein